MKFSGARACPPDGRNKTMFEQMNIFGLGEIEDLILAGLVTGDPVLLVGRHGSGKTMLTKKIAESMNTKFIAYDASKALFDDVIGFPNPKSMCDGVLDYIPTPISIWDKEFVLVDEISRANPSMQNKWLEIIRSRQVMGKHIPNLKYVFAAMNPAFSYTGANPLDPALSGRFAFIIPVPEAYNMETEDIKKIIQNVCDDDAVALVTPTGVMNAAPTNERAGKPALRAPTREIVNQGRELYPKLADKYHAILGDYILKLSSNLLMNRVKVDGRRLGMINRNCLAYLAVKTIKHVDVEKDFMDHVYHCVRHSLPDEQTGEPIREDVVMSAHLSSVKDGCYMDKYRLWTNILNCESVVDMVTMFIKYHEDLSNLRFQEIVSLLSERWEKNLVTAREIVDMYLGVKQLLVFFQEHCLAVGCDTTRRLMTLYSSMFFLTGMMDNDLGVTRTDEDKPFSIKFSDPVCETAYRLAYTAQIRMTTRPRYNPGNTGFNANLYEQIKMILEKEQEIQNAA
jgi:hypothetical protein